jgi:hypothetical protein
MDPLDFLPGGKTRAGSLGFPRVKAGESGTNDLPPAWHFRLAPNVRLFVALDGSQSCSVILEARKALKGQDGFCGNFNGDGEDDSFKALQRRGFADAVKESLFHPSPGQGTPPELPEHAQEDAKLLVPSACRAGLLTLSHRQLRSAIAACEGLRAPAQRQACVEVLCAASAAPVPAPAVEDESEEEAPQKTTSTAAPPEEDAPTAPQEEEAPKARNDSSSGKGANFNCMAGYSNWEVGWSQPKKNWCCDHWGVGCPRTAGTRGASMTGYTLKDCMATDPAYMEAWSAERRGFCCSRLDVGCGAPPSQTQPGEPASGELDFRKFETQPKPTPDGAGRHSFRRWAWPFSSAPPAVAAFTVAFLVSLMALALAAAKMCRRQKQLQRRDAELSEAAPGGHGGSERSRLLAVEQC